MDIKFPVEIASIDHHFNRLASTKDGSYLVGIKDNGFSIFDISNKKSAIIETASNYTFSKVLSCFLVSHSGNALYLISSDLYIFNITDKKHPMWISTIPLNSNSTAMVLNKAGTKLYVAGDFLYCFNLVGDFNFTLDYSVSVLFGKITDMVLFKDEDGMFAKLVFEVPDIQFYLSGLCLIQDLKNPYCLMPGITTDKIRLFYHGLYLSKKYDLVYYAAGYDGMISMIGRFASTFEKFGTRETFGFQIAEDESFMVVLDGIGLKTSRIIYPIRNDPVGEYAEKIVSFIQMTSESVNFYIGPNEKNIFIFSKLSDDGNSYEIKLARIDSPTLVSLPYDEIAYRASSIVENPLNNGETYLFATDSGVFEYDPSTNVFSSPKFYQNLRHLTRIPGSELLLCQFFGFVFLLDINQDFVGISDFMIEEDAIFIPQTNLTIFCIRGDTFYRLLIDYTSSFFSITITNTLNLGSIASECILGSRGVNLYIKNPNGIDVYDISGFNPVKLSSYIRPGNDTTIAVDDWRNLMYYYTNNTIYAINIFDRANIHDNYTLSLPHTINKMWISPSQDSANFYLIAMTPSEIVTININPPKVAFIDQKVFQIGVTSSLVMYLLDQMRNIDNNYYSGLNPDDYAPIDIKFYNFFYIKGSSYETFYDLPYWVTVNIPGRELTFAPDKKDAIGDYYLFIAFSKKIMTSDFDDALSRDNPNHVTSQEAFSELMKLGYLTTEGFLTSKFKNKKIEDLPTRMISLGEKITGVLGKNYYYNKYKISVISSLKLDMSEAPHINIGTLDSVQLIVQITLTNAVFSPNLKMINVFAQLSSDRSIITLSGLRDPIVASLALLSLNAEEENILAFISINDGLNPTINQEIKNITKFMKVNNMPILNRNFSEIQVIPIRQSSIELLTNLFIDTNDRGDIISYGVFLINNNTNDLDPLPSFLTFDMTRNILYADPSLSDAFFYPENKTYQRDYALMILASSTTGLISSFNFTLRVKNEPPFDNLPVSYQLAGIKFYTGISFSIALQPDTFVDFDGDSISYSLESADENGKVPEWITLKGLELRGEPPQELFGSYKFSLVASDGISKSSSLFIIQPSVSFNHFLNLIYTYIGIIVGASAILSHFVKIHKIFCVESYRYPHVIPLRRGQAITLEDMPPITIISDLEKRIKEIKMYAKKNKMISPTDEISTFKDKIEIMIGWSKKIHHGPKLTAEKRKILYSLIFYQLVEEKISLKQNKALFKIFQRLKLEWNSIITISLQRDEKGPARALPSFEIHDVNYESHTKSHHLSENEDELLRYALLGYVFNNHVIVYNQAKLCFRYYEKKILKGFFKSLLFFESESRLKFADYGISALFKDEILTFSGGITRQLGNDLIYFRIMRSSGILKDLILKEIVFKLEEENNKVKIYAKK